MKAGGYLGFICQIVGILNTLVLVPSSFFGQKYFYNTIVQLLNFGGIAQVTFRGA